MEHRVKRVNNSAFSFLSLSIPDSFLWEEEYLFWFFRSFLPMIQLLLLLPSLLSKVPLIHFSSFSPTVVFLPQEPFPSLSLYTPLPETERKFFLQGWLVSVNHSLTHPSLVSSSFPSRLIVCLSMKEVDIVTSIGVVLAATELQGGCCLCFDVGNISFLSL